jgi:CubicO group peptidase (beta-lactamase class C family)
MIDVKRLEGEIGRQHEVLPFSGVILIREKREVIFGKAYGFANRAESIPNTIETRFANASGAKTTTALAICTLVHKGLIGFDTRLADCLDIKFPKYDPAITVHRLLTHSSGVGDYFDEEVMDDYEGYWKDRPVQRFREPRDFLPLFQDLPMKFAPGTRFSYNNTGYIVLALIVEQVSGMPFAEYIRQAILKPCGMADSGYFAMDQLPARTAYGYIEDEDGGWHTNFYSVPIIGGGDGGLIVTAPDVARLWDALLDRWLLSKEITEQMLRPHLPTGEEDHAYGYGVWIGMKGARVHKVYMLGEDPGAAFFSAWYPESDMNLTVIGNSTHPMWAMLEKVKAVVEAG